MEVAEVVMAWTAWRGRSRPRPPDRGGSTMEAATMVSLLTPTLSPKRSWALTLDGTSRCERKKYSS